MFPKNSTNPLCNFFGEISILQSEAPSACSPSDLQIDTSFGTDPISNSSALLHLDHSSRTLIVANISILPTGTKCQSNLCIFKTKIVIRKLYWDSRLFDVEVKSSDMAFYLSCVYGHHNPKCRHLPCERIEVIGTNRRGP